MDDSIAGISAPQHSIIDPPGGDPFRDVTGLPKNPAIGTTRLEHPDQLRQAGRKATSLASGAHSLHSIQSQETKEAARELDGEKWSGQIGSALHYLEERWHAQCTALQKQCTTLGDGLERTADAYKNTEDANTDIMQSANAVAVQKDFG